MAKEIDWRREVRKSVVEAAFGASDGLAAYMMGLINKGVLFDQIMMAQANQKTPVASSRDLKNLVALVPPLEDMPDDVIVDHGWYLLTEKSVGDLINYLNNRSVAMTEEIEIYARSELKEKGIDPHARMTEEEAAAIKKKLDKAVERMDWKEMARLRRALDSGLSKKMLDLMHQVRDRWIEYLTPMIKEFGSPAAPSMSG